MNRAIAGNMAALLAVVVVFGVFTDCRADEPAGPAAAIPATQPNISAPDWLGRAAGIFVEEKLDMVYYYGALIEATARLGTVADVSRIPRPKGYDEPLKTGCFLRFIVAGLGARGDLDGAKGVLASFRSKEPFSNEDRGWLDWARMALLKSLVRRGQLKEATQLLPELNTTPGVLGRDDKTDGLGAILSAQVAAGDAKGALAAAEAITPKEAGDRVFGEIALAQARAGDMAGARATASKIATETSFFSKARVLEALPQCQAAGALGPIFKKFFGPDAGAVPEPPPVVDMHITRGVEAMVMAFKAKDADAQMKALQDARAALEVNRDHFPDSVYANFYRAEGWCYLAVTYGALGDQGAAKAAAAKAFAYGLKTERERFSDLTPAAAPILAWVLVTLKDYEGVAKDLQALYPRLDGYHDPIPMARALGMAMARQHRGGELLDLLGKVDSPIHRFSICLGAAEADLKAAPETSRGPKEAPPPVAAPPDNPATKTQQDKPAAGPDWSGAWEVTWLKGQKTPVTLKAEGPNRFRITGHGAVGGLYEVQGDKLVRVGTPKECVWYIRGADNLVLVTAPQIAGANSGGVTLTRVK